MEESTFNTYYNIAVQDLARQTEGSFPPSVSVAFTGPDHYQLSLEHVQACLVPSLRQAICEARERCAMLAADFDSPANDAVGLPLGESGCEPTCLGGFVMWKKLAALGRIPCLTANFNGALQDLVATTLELQDETVLNEFDGSCPYIVEGTFCDVDLCNAFHLICYLHENPFPCNLAGLCSKLLTPLLLPLVDLHSFVGLVHPGWSP